MINRCCMTGRLCATRRIGSRLEQMMGRDIVLAQYLLLPGWRTVTAIVDRGYGEGLPANGLYIYTVVHRYVEPLAKDKTEGTRSVRRSRCPGGTASSLPISQPSTRNVLPYSEVDGVRSIARDMPSIFNIVPRPHCRGDSHRDRPFKTLRVL